ncbi:hypothetical protein Tco_1363647 [Tanacetum coccineum]
MSDDEIMSISEDDKEVESDKELSIADEVVANKVIDEMLTEINTWVSTSNAFAKHTTKALWAKMNVPRTKPINVQALGTMKKFNQIQISSAPKLAILEKSIHKLIYKNVRVTIGEVPNHLLVVNSKDLTTKVNHTSSDMDELVG